LRILIHQVVAPPSLVEYMLFIAIPSLIHNNLIIIIVLTVYCVLMFYLLLHKKIWLLSCHS